MLNAPISLPFYAKASLLLIGMYVFFSILAIAQGIILPLIYATFLAIAISPAVNFLVKKKVYRALSIAIVLFIFVLIVGALITMLFSQASRFSEAIPHLAIKIQVMISQMVVWASDFFNISADKINIWIAQTKEEYINKSSAFIGITLNAIGVFMAATVISIVYIFMILLYQSHLLEFIHKLFGISNNQNVSEMLTETKTIIQSYLVGLFSEIAIVAVMNVIGLLILGMDYAILLGIFGALLNIIPYIGGMIGGGVFMVIALVTKEPVYVLYVFLLYSFIQIIDNNYIVPKIVGSKVKLNPFICLIVVIAGAALWGIAGMFLAIPLTAVIKLIFDRIDLLKPWGFLLGDTIHTSQKMKLNFTIKGFLTNFTSKNDKHL